MGGPFLLEGRGNSMATPPETPPRSGRSRERSAAWAPGLGRSGPGVGSIHLVFRRLLEQAVVTSRVTEVEITHGYAW